MFITIGIPTHNEENVIIDCLHSCNSQTKKPDEIIVVASGCTDNTIPSIKEYQKHHSNVKLIIEEKRNGKISAINKILKASKGDLIVHTDGDVILNEDAVEKLSFYFQKYNFISGVSGTAKIVRNSSSLFYHWAKKMVSILNKNKIIEFRKGYFFHISGYIFAHKRGSITEVPPVKGATDATMGSILREKGLIVFDPKIKAMVKHPNNVQDFIRQKARIRYGFLCLNKRFKSDRTLFSEIKHIGKLFAGNKIFVSIGFLYLSLLYLASWLKAHMWLKKEASLEEIWKPVVSTK